MSKKENEIDLSRRKFLKMVSIGSAVVALGAFAPSLSYIVAPTIGVSEFPALTLVDSSGNPIKASTIAVNNPQIVLFDYPLLNEPNFLLNLGKSVPGGVGPQNSIVAYSAICEHLGCLPPSIKFYPPGSPPIDGYTSYIHCSCHGSTFDPFNRCSIITSPTTKPQPMVVLTYDSSTDTLQAVKMNGPVIYGHTDDLTGGSPPKGNTAPVTTLNNQ
ncbi:MAG: Rieske 2Fe-2S domain-containing protein [Candidatus Thermoplasmatota archaeon]|jgi:arsenite oxidase small subunit|nr:Rieske 2Fe-2S domain-containing protein [Candidatus Thermoplasmatota archaeon]MCL5962893.1 Rieske 2Fe-2S domain-containing protein [Candidatus Thermoplasmatota archaeon]